LHLISKDDVRVNSRHSRFDAFNSRLGRCKFPFSTPRELLGNGLIWLIFFAAKRRLEREIGENSRLNGKNREAREGARGWPKAMDRG
jgi:hypothetical protein